MGPTPIPLVIYLVLKYPKHFMYICLCCGYRKAVLPIEAELNNSESEANDEDSDTDLDIYINKLNKMKEDLFKTAKRNIDEAQMKQKRDYDKKYVIGKKNVSMSITCMCV